MILSIDQTREYHWQGEPLFMDYIFQLRVPGTGHRPRLTPATVQSRSPPMCPVHPYSTRPSTLPLCLRGPVGVQGSGFRVHPHSTLFLGSRGSVMARSSRYAETITSTRVHLHVHISRMYTYTYLCLIFISHRSSNPLTKNPSWSTAPFLPRMTENLHPRAHASIFASPSRDSPRRE